jgi:hypothetical protein
MPAGAAADAGDPSGRDGASLRGPSVTPVDTKSAAIGGTRPRNGRDETLPF